MKNFIVLISFLGSMIFGVMISGSSNLSRRFDNYLHRGCMRQGDETFDKPAFTLQEANYLLGKKVVSRNNKFRKNETGRIISFEMIAPDKFLIEIYWGKGVEDENSNVTFQDKENFSEDFELVD